MKPESFGQRLKRLRRIAGLSQARLAEAAGLPAGTVRGYEYDRRQPFLAAAVKLAAALGVSLGELAGVEVKPTPKKGR
jgi:transcriptional regulator with XRE-family HTH domain